MIDLLPADGRMALNVLCLGAHCDDIEIGCSATMRKLVTSGREIHVYWNVLSSSAGRAEEAFEGARRVLEGSNDPHVEVSEFRNGYFPFIGAELKDHFERLKKRFDPDIVFTHYRGDLHQDHKVVSDLTWNTFRNQWILEYEIPKYDGDLGSPNFFSPVSRELVTFKTSTIVECFTSQKHKHWFDRSTFEGLMRMRGAECASTSGYAEAFYVRKSILRWS